jgi:hypothetical protein
MKLTDIVTEKDCFEAVGVPDEIKRNFVDEQMPRLKRIIYQLAAGSTLEEAEAVGAAICILDAAIQRATRNRTFAP